MARHNLEVIRIPYEQEINCIPRELANNIRYIILDVTWSATTGFENNFYYDVQFMEAYIVYKNGELGYFFKYGTWTNWRKGKLVCDDSSCETFSDGPAPDEISKFLNCLLYTHPDEDVHEYPVSIEYIIFDGELAREVLSDKETIRAEYDIYSNIEVVKAQCSEFLRALEILVDEKYLPKVLKEYSTYSDMILFKLTSNKVTV